MRQWSGPLNDIDRILSSVFVIIIIIIEKWRQYKAVRERYSPYQLKLTTATQCQPIERKKSEGAISQAMLIYISNVKTVIRVGSASYSVLSIF